MIALRAFFASMTGRAFTILFVGMIGAALGAVAITRWMNDHAFEKEMRELTADRLEGYLDFLDAAPLEMRPHLLTGAGFRVRVQPPSLQGIGVDPPFQETLIARGGLLASAVVEAAGLEVCFPELGPLTAKDKFRFWDSAEVKRIEERANSHRGGLLRLSKNRIFPPGCRLVTVSLHDGTRQRFSIEWPWTERERSSLFEPSFLVLLTLATSILAYAVARLASAPLERLAVAAVELGQDLDRAPVQVSGPTEVQHAAAAFNAMRRRLQQHIRERTQMLAAITHDLQTPLTRLRLRLERVEDEALRERLVADWGAMKALVDEGLELARSAETSEPRVMLDLDSLLESLVEDVTDAGGHAVFEQRCHAVLRLQPLAARRLFSNLIDNAIKYGGSAQVSAVRVGDGIAVRVRDPGPGLPDDMLERVFDPFVRGDASRLRQTGGAGLGLTIARMLAEKNGAKLTLRNHPDGGLEAVTQWANIEALTSTKV